MPLHGGHLVFAAKKKIKPPPIQKMELDKKVLVQIANELKERDDQLDELKFLNDEMRRGYEQQIAILKDLNEKTKSTVDADQIKALIDRKEKEISKLIGSQEDIGRPDNVDVQDINNKKKNGLRTSASKKSIDANVKKVWK